jgi:acyl carrier protein
MSTDRRAILRNFITDLLAKKGDSQEFSDAEFLFTSGRLDSVAAMEVVLFLEGEFATDLSQTHFDLQRIDSVDNIISLIPPR